MILKVRNNLIFLIATALFLTGCGSIGLAKDSSFDSSFDNVQMEEENIYVSSARVIYKGLDVSGENMEFYVAGTSKILSLSYDGTTVIHDRHSQSMVAAQLQVGDIATIAYSSSQNKVGAIILDSEGFNYENISKYSLDRNNNHMSIGEDMYNYSSNTKIFSGGQEITVDQLINHDVVTIQGIGDEILSIRVDDGHGYLELVNDDSMLGGWIEIGQTVISKVAEDMLFTVPEGDYMVRLTNSGIEEYRTVSINRNDITKLDIGDIKTPDPDKGIVSFEVLPVGASVKVDGKSIDLLYPIRLSVGIHEITASASGHDTVTQYFEVDGQRQVVSLELGQFSEKNTVSGNSLDYEDKYSTITIDSPVDVEVYEDNIYKGITPLSYKKSVGTHVITLRKSGYVTTSYTVDIVDDDRNQTFSFADLILEKTEGQNNPLPTATLLYTELPTSTILDPGASPTTVMVTYYYTDSETPSYVPTSTIAPTGSPTGTPFGYVSATPSVTPTASISPTPSVSPTETSTPSIVPYETVSPYPVSSSVKSPESNVEIIIVDYPSQEEEVYVDGDDTSRSRAK